MYYVIMWDERCVHEAGTDGKDREESEHTTTFGTREVNDSRGDACAALVTYGGRMRARRSVAVYGP